MTEGNFNVISLFSGCGGSSLGYHMAGGNVLCAVEKEKHAANNYIDNLLYHGSPLFQIRPLGKQPSFCGLFAGLPPGC